MTSPKVKKWFKTLTVCIMVLVLIGLYTAITEPNKKLPPPTTDHSNILNKNDTDKSGTLPPNPPESTAKNRRIQGLVSAPVCASTVQFSADTFTIPEGSSTPAGANLVLSASCGVDVKVNVYITPKITGDGAWTATDPNSTTISKEVHGTGEDIRTSIACVTITAGQTTATIPLSAIEDAFAETDETFTVNLSEYNINLGARTTSVGTVWDNDRATAGQLTSSRANGIFTNAAYGATPNDGTYDSTAIQAMMDAAAASTSTRGVLTFAPGTYNINLLHNGSIGVIVPPGLTIKGYGAIFKRQAAGCGNPQQPGNQGNDCGNIEFKTNTWNNASDSNWLVFAGVTFDGNIAQQNFNYSNAYVQQQSRSLELQAQSCAGPPQYSSCNYGRLRAVTEDVTTQYSVSDGVMLGPNVEHRAWNMVGKGNFRGALVATGGNARASWWDLSTTHGEESGYPFLTGIDIEVDGYGRSTTAAAQPGNTNGNDRSLIMDMHNFVLDSDFDVSLYSTGDIVSFCGYANKCGPNSAITADNVTMLPATGADYSRSAGFFDAQVDHPGDSYVITNSLLRTGGHNADNTNFILSAAGTIDIRDTTVIVGKWGAPSSPNTSDQSFQYQDFGSSSGTLTFERVNFIAESFPYAPTNKCGLYRLTNNGTVNAKSVTFTGTGWCNGTGFQGPVNISTAGATTTTTSTTIPNQQLCGGAPAPTTTLGVTLCTDGVRTQGEVASITGDWAAISDSGALGGQAITHPGLGFTGNATFTVTSPGAGTYNLCIRMRTGGSGMERGIKINGGATTDVYSAQVAAWGLVYYGPFTFTDGVNSIVIGPKSTGANPGLIDIDFVDICPISYTPTTTTLAPTTTGAGTTTSTSSTTSTSTTSTTTTTSTTLPGSNRNEIYPVGCTYGSAVIFGEGRAYGNSVTQDATTNITCSISNGGSAGAYTMTFNYTAFNGPDTRGFVVNGNATTILYPASGGAPATSTKSVTLTTGINTIVFNLAGVSLDWFEFGSGTFPTTTTTTSTTTTTITPTIPNTPRRIYCTRHPRSRLCIPKANSNSNG